MKLRVLGCHGGELPGHRTTSFLIDGTLALDAGALTGALPLERLLAVDHVILSHSHLDHVKDLPLLADLLVGRRERPLKVHASAACARTLRKNLFNDALWPDFTRIPSRSRPVLEFVPFALNEPFEAGGYRVLPVPVSHPVQSCGFLVSDGRVTLGFSGDTGPTDGLWQAFAGAGGSLGGVFVETSFPNELQALADVSGHLTPDALGRELRKVRLRPSCELLHYHLKPAYLRRIERELRASRLGGRVLELDDELTF